MTNAQASKLVPPLQNQSDGQEWGRVGYRGPAPNRSDRPDPAMHADHMAHFRGNEMRAGGGHEGGRR